MEVKVSSDGAGAAVAAAAWLAGEARRAVAARGRFAVALSGGRSPWQMLEALAGEDVPWSAVHLFQVDERVAPAGDDVRNLTRLGAIVAGLPLPPANLHPMPVEEPDLEAAAAAYARVLGEVAGAPPVLDLVHLGLGEDGHTASLVPGDSALDVRDRDVALTGGPYQGRRRMTLTYPMIDRARARMWLVTGAGKVPMLQRLRDGDAGIPAGRVSQDASIVFADAAAVG